jgi:signal peptidase I
MFDKWRKYSYAAQKTRRHRVWRILFWIAVFFTAYTLLTSLVFSMKALETDAMRPGFEAGDRLVFSSYRIYSLVPGLKMDYRSLPFRRGNAVLVDMSLREKPGLFPQLLDGILRFFTAQRFGFLKGGEQIYLKRVIGLPGDEITIINFVVRVKPKGGAYSFTEYELWDSPYVADIPQVPALWDESLPFSGNMEKILLGEDECFVLSDDRSNTNDSRTWGPVPVRLIAGKALFRYWPFTRLGRP